MDVDDDVVNPKFSSAFSDGSSLQPPTSLLFEGIVAIFFVIKL